MNVYTELIRVAKMVEAARFDGYAVEYRNMRTAVHGLVVGQKREIEKIDDMMSELEKIQENRSDDKGDEYEDILDEMLSKNADWESFEEINFRDVNHDDMTYSKNGKTYKIVNPHCYDLWNI